MFLWIFLAGFLLRTLLYFYLDWLNLKSLDANKNEVPELYRDYIDQEKYQKSIAYTKAKNRFAWLNTIFDVVLLWTLVFVGFFYQADRWLLNYVEPGLWQSTLYVLAISGLFYFISLPFSYYFQFKLEEHFGFNKMNVKTFIMDQFKSIFIGALLGIPLLLLIFWLVQKSGTWWWFYAWAAMMGFQFLIAALFPVVLAPLFYKFTPLEEGELKDRIEAIAKKINFKMSGIYTIDGSKRSGHSNAFFAGMGKTRRIVLYDTLVESLTTDELVNVLAHEMGHNVKKHIRSTLIMSSLVTLGGFYVLSWLLNTPEFFRSFAVEQPSVHVGFLLFFLFSSTLTFPLDPLFKAFSRKNEYEADAFAVEVTGDSKSLVTALVKLSRDNLSNLTPHPWYSFFHYDHPTTLERAEAMEKIKA